MMLREMNERTRRYYEAADAAWGAMKSSNEMRLEARRAAGAACSLPPQAKQMLMREELARFAERWPDWGIDEIRKARDLFTSFDMNSDGVIDFDEL